MIKQQWPIVARRSEGGKGCLLDVNTVKRVSSFFLEGRASICTFVSGKLRSVVLHLPSGVCVSERKKRLHMLNFASFRKQVSHGEGGHDDTAPNRIGKEIEKQIICFDRKKNYPSRPPSWP